MTNPIVEMQTSMGLIVIELDQQNSPNTVQNFLSYVDEDFYQGTIFHRVINGFMVQGGGFNANGTQKKTHAPINIESDNGLTNLRGTIAMARTNDPNSATSQFFINTVDNSFLNKAAGNPGYTVFGKVIVGMDVVDKMSLVKTQSNPMADWPVEPIIINTVTRR
jgi:cyclophilin family peptidyl-prolyl cis-trans isomerase